MNNQENEFEFPGSISLLRQWQIGEETAKSRLTELFAAVAQGEYDSMFREPAPVNSVCVTTSLHLLTLTILNQLFGMTSSEFYKGDPARYVRTNLMTQRLIGIRKFTLGWPVYAFGAEALGQSTMYPEGQAPGADPDVPLVDVESWSGLGEPNFKTGIPLNIDEMLEVFENLTGIEPVAHLPAPYSLAADIFGQEALISALLEAPEFVDQFLDHLTARVLVPWIDHITDHIPNVWIELSDASGSPLFISPSLFLQKAARPVLRLVNDYPWGHRVFVANYRGDHLVQIARGRGKRRKNNLHARRGRREDNGRGKAGQSLSALIELIEFKLRVCPEFLIKLEADRVPASFYVDQAIQRGKPLYLGIGATKIDRNSIVDRNVAGRELQDVAEEYATAIRTVSETLHQKGQSRSDLPWPGDIYIEDINSETDLELVKIIIETVDEVGRLSHNFR